MYTWSFSVQWAQLRCEVIVRFADIDGIDNLDCFNFRLVTLYFFNCHMWTLQLVYSHFFWACQMNDDSLGSLKWRST